jgi:hypothetical protein
MDEDGLIHGYCPFHGYWRNSEESHSVTIKRVGHDPIRATGHYVGCGQCSTFVVDTIIGE